MVVIVLATLLTLTTDAATIELSPLANDVGVDAGVVVVVVVVPRSFGDS